MRQIIKSKTVNDADLELINNYSSRPLTRDEVFAFSLTLCDNDIDRDQEAFDDDAISKLKELMVGVTGIYDHNPTSKNQTARIYSTWIETTQETTLLGTPRKTLKAKAYMVKSDRLKDTILEIEAGILKEVSISCSVKEKVCSICGKVYDGSCGHVQGRLYGKTPCYVKLCDPYDAYEWSFVAIPAQKKAGVTKKTHTQPKQANKAVIENGYINTLRKEVCKLAFLSNFLKDESALGSIVEKMNLSELEAFKREFSKKLSNTSPFLQLGFTQSAKEENLEDFKI